MSSHSDPGRCRVSGPGPMSSHPGRGRFRAERARADIETSGPRLMSSLAGLGHCRVQRAWVVVTDPD